MREEPPPAARSGLPPVIVCGPYTYKVELGGPKHLRDSVESGNGHELLGCADHEMLTVTVRPDMAHDAEAATLLHEVLHCALNALGKPLDREVEEKVVSALEPILLLVIRDNPFLIEYLQGRS